MGIHEMDVFGPIDRRLWKRSLAALALAAGVGFAGAATAENDVRTETGAVAPIAVADFDYHDTSGEVRDQSAEHRTRLSAFMTKLRIDLGADPRFRVLSIACADPPGTAGGMAPATLLNAAKNAGARMLLYGQIDKTSTLIEWGRVQIVDVVADKLVFDRLMTFRGDTDEAWLRAESFLVKELQGGDFTK
jgi:uncharacterized protein DUF2380